MLEGFTDFLNKIMDGIMWRALLSRLDWVDWFTAGFIILGLAYGSRKGLMRELVEVLELALIIFLSFTYREVFVSFLKSILPSFTNRMLEPLVLIMTLLIFWVLIAFIDRYLQKTIHAKTSSGLKGIGGAFVGAFHFLLIWSLISQIIIATPYFNLSQQYDKGNSVTGEKVRDFAPAVHIVINAIPRLFSAAKS